MKKDGTSPSVCVAASAVVGAAADALGAAATGRARPRPRGALATPRDLPPFLVVFRERALVVATAVLGNFGVSIPFLC